KNKMTIIYLRNYITIQRLLYDDENPNCQQVLNQITIKTSEKLTFLHELHHLTSLKMNSTLSNTGSTFITPENAVIPDEIDWRKKGAVTRVKDQGDCGSCWAFSSVGSIEGQQFRKSGVLTELSEQNLVDCDTENWGCDGGLMNTIFNYVQKNGGIDTEKTYPYEAKDGKCRFNRSNVGATISGYVSLPRGDENKLTEAVATIGPISVGMNVPRDFCDYSEGIIYQRNCDPDRMRHAVLVVGYGTDKETKEDYYIIKNSWGESWGMKGYFLMARNKNNNCGIATAASYPLP
ncbi:hypothetical protein L9F63_005603, partial [Diploptera punctata]